MAAMYKEYLDPRVNSSVCLLEVNEGLYFQ